MNKIAVCLHGYYGTLSVGDFTTSKKGFEHIKSVFGNNVDFYVHCWQPEMTSQVEEMYQPLDSHFEKQINFKEIMGLEGISQEYIDEGFPRNLTMYKNATFERILSFYYSRCESLKMALKSAKKYDWIVTTRFDISARGGDMVNNIRFISESDPSFLHTADWNQKNAGYGDMWFYGGEETMKSYSSIYGQALEDFKRDSLYQETLTQGWPYSLEYNENDHSDIRQFSNECDKIQTAPESQAIKMKYPKWRMSDSHLHHKWFCLSNDLFHKTKWV